MPCALAVKVVGAAVRRRVLASTNIIHTYDMIYRTAATEKEVLSRSMRSNYIC